SGADVGYGAKAEEVLGQVRGRDFRHEKTKKKRGSYRGGQIDLQSHSIKFDYSDEE
nr:nucleolar and coiled-body phosphoprotein 1 isoform X2 [Tanacetum cinerariifolium]